MKLVQIKKIEKGEVVKDLIDPEFKAIQFCKRPQPTECNSYNNGEQDDRQDHVLSQMPS